MSGTLRSLALIVLVGIAGCFLWPALQASPKHAPPPPVKIASIPKPPSGARIWYSTGHYPELPLPGGRHVAVRSLLNISKPMHFGDFVWSEDHIPQGRVWVRVDLAHQLLSVFRGGHEIGSSVILYGDDSYATPTGNFTVLAKSQNYFSHSYQAPMPYALRLTNDGVAIHGSNVREGWATHGCIGVPLDFARLLFAVVSKGDLVVILPAQSTAIRA